VSLHVVHGGKHAQVSGVAHDLDVACRSAKRHLLHGMHTPRTHAGITVCHFDPPVVCWSNILIFCCMVGLQVCYRPSTRVGQPRMLGPVRFRQHLSPTAGVFTGEQTEVAWQQQFLTAEQSPLPRGRKFPVWAKVQGSIPTVSPTPTPPARSSCDS